ncbi:hypothetical protein HK100_002568 [Physocladia obscura]|uniref:Uncharacterized protein n=1 Tax=Physocladia obscura TaxID=109957 RepID=A0AAD5TFR8_9FUNG|nr:hypothetical protein HK100_002568 [Physocladia obscura]
MSAQQSSSQVGENADSISIGISINVNGAGPSDRLLSDTATAGGATAGITRAEVLTSIANRILYSKYYRWLYFAMGIASFFCLVLSFVEQCPSGLFLWTDALVNLAMIAEVLIRVNAMGKVSESHSVDEAHYALTASCCEIRTFINQSGTLLISRDNSSWETELDALLLIARNSVQLFRLLMMMNKNRDSLLRRQQPQAIDFSNAAPAVDFLGVGNTGELPRHTSIDGTGSGGARVASSVFDFEGEEDDWGF